VQVCQVERADRPSKALELSLIIFLAFALVPLLTGIAGADALPGGTLDPNTIPKYVSPLIIPPAIPPVEGDYYQISVQQFEQQILPPGMPKTTVWSYGAVGHPETLNYPAFTIEAEYDRPVVVKWINGLIDEAGNHLPHLLPVDQTLHWANPNMTGAMGAIDSRGDDPTPYTGPVPMVTHVHGAHVGPESDGYPEAWWLPDANDIPAGFATRGTHWGQIPGEKIEPGTATFRYPNDQPATTLWYHDHTLGMTRLNVYAGPAGFYLLRGGPNDTPAGVLPGPAPQLGDAPGTDYYEIPIVIQGRSFNEDGSLFYPDDRAFFEELDEPQLQIPFIPDDAAGGPSDVSPMWVPEFFGNTMVVNGRTWPYLEVEPRRYRLRLLNGTQGRFLVLRFDQPLDFWQIGAEGGFLPAPVKQTELLMGPAERADVIVDFSEFTPGENVTLLNMGPDEPFGGGEFEPADPGTTGQVMQFRVVPLTGQDTSTDPAGLTLPSPSPLGAADNTRTLSLNELESETVFVAEDEFGNVIEPPDPGDDEGEDDGEGNGGESELEPFGPIAAMLGTLDAQGNGIPLTWMDTITENPTLGSTEVWEIHNFTADAHPIHLHLVQFQVVDREILTDDAPHYTEAAPNVGQVMPPEAGETGFKDTVIAYPGEITRVKAKFDVAGLFVWHCHIVEHEDNEMMRPYAVLSDGVDPAFPDVPETSEYHHAVSHLAGRDVINGYDDGTFGLFDNVLRAQLAKMTVMAFNQHDQPVTNAASPSFDDVMYNGDVYPFDFVEEATEVGYVRGFVGGSFGPYAPLTRVQLVRVLVRAGGDALEEPPAGYDPGFADVDPADIAVVAKAKYNGLIDGTGPTTFDPYGPATRGHVSKVLYGVLAL
jgi:spore coat protein A